MLFAPAIAGQEIPYIRAIAAKPSLGLTTCVRFVPVVTAGAAAAGGTAVGGIAVGGTAVGCTGCAADMSGTVALTPGAVDPGMIRLWPGRMWLGSAMLLALAISVQVIPNFWAMIFSVSPPWTV